MDFLIYCCILIFLSYSRVSKGKENEQNNIMMSDNNVPIVVDLPVGNNLALKKISNPYSAILKQLGLVN